jgi:membrane protein
MDARGERVMRMRDIGSLFIDAGVKFWNDKAPRLGAALAFYTALSLSPLLLLVIGIAGLVFGREAARGEIVHQLRDLIGDQGAQAIETMIAHSGEPSHGIWATVAGLVMLVIGATGVFAQLQDALNTAWGVDQEPSTRSREGSWLAAVVTTIWDRVLSFSLVCGLAFLLLVSLVANTALTAFQGWLIPQAPAAAILLIASNSVLSFLLTWLLFALIFRVLPNAEIAWSDVWIGAGLTAILFSVGKYLIGLYLGSAAIGSTFGAAGSFVVLLVWIYYSTQILLYGAEFTQLYATRHGSGIRVLGDEPEEATARVSHQIAVTP